jgi:DNA polymerase-4
MKLRFGTYGVMLHHHANGIDDRKVAPYDEVKSISRETTFEHDTLDQRFLEAILWRLSERVGFDLRSQDKRARTVGLKLRYADFETITRRLTFKAAIASNEAIFDAAVQLLGQALDRKRKLVRLVGVGVSNLVSDAKQLNLIVSELQRRELVNKAVDRVRKKYGFTSIQAGRTFALKDTFSDNESA